MRGSPSTTRTSRSKALRLFFLCALATLFSTALTCLRLATLASSASRASKSSRAYQTSRFPIVGEAPHRLAVCLAGAEDRGAGLLRREFAVATGDLEARREALDVPLPGPRQGLVEVVDVEDDAPVGGGEGAEVGEVGVAAGLHPQARVGGLGEVHRHDRRGAAEEGEGRGQHPPVADRDELGYAVLGLLLEHRDRISAVPRRLPIAVTGSVPSPAPPFLRPRSQQREHRRRRGGI